MRIFFIFCLLFTFITPCFADLSDFTVRPVHSRLDTKEDFFRLYTRWLHNDIDAISRNIYFLELAYALPYEHPIKALIPITDKRQYEKYKLAIMMHLSVQLTNEYIRFASLYIKENIYFFNEEFFDTYLKGYDTASFYLESARLYWNNSKDYANQMQEYKDITLNYEMTHHLFSFEDESFRIRTGDLDYEKLINRLVSSIENNRKTIHNWENS